MECIEATVKVGRSLFLQGGLASAVEGVLQPCLALLGQGALGVMEAHLSKPVRNFRPSLESSGKVDEQKVEDAIASWLEEVGGGARSEGAALLGWVESVQGVAGVREELGRCLNAGEGTGDVYLWNKVYREVLTDRVLKLLKNKVEEIRKDVGGKVVALLRGWKDWKGREWVWQEVAGQGAKGLELRCRAWDPEVQEVLAALEQGLHEVWAQGQEYCAVEASTSCSFDRLADRSRILEQLGEEVLAAVQELVTEYKKEAQELQESQGVAQLLLGRLLQAAPDLCPSLAPTLGPEHLVTSKKLLEQEAESCFVAWIEAQLSSLSLCLPSLLPSLPLTLLPAWDRVTIQELGEEGEQVNTVILIPPSPSLPLHSSLLSLSSSLHHGHPPSLPSTTLPTATKHVLSLLLPHYTSLAKERMAQTIALQLSFDLRFLQLLLVAREAKEMLTTTFTQLIEQVEANIDPFDLSVFTPHLTTRVRWAAARNVSSLAPLVPPDRVALISSYKPPSATGGQDCHNVLSLPSPAAPRSAPAPLLAPSLTMFRFQLLPLAPAPSPSIPSPGRGLLSVEPKKTTTTRRPRDKYDPSSSSLLTFTSPSLPRSPAAQTAASFFGSMSQGWFGAAP